jgi:hypothetical protein
MALTPRGTFRQCNQGWLYGINRRRQVPMRTQSHNFGRWGENEFPHDLQLPVPLQQLQQVG